MTEYKKREFEVLNQPRKKRGRPPKKEVEAKKNRNSVGRPKGDAAIMNDYKARLLASPKSRKVLDTILNAALDDEHKHQAAAWKIITDRIMPISSFDSASGSKPHVEITITGLGVEVSSPKEPVIDGDIIDG